MLCARHPFPTEDRKDVFGLGDQEKVIANENDDRVHVASSTHFTKELRLKSSASFFARAHVIFAHLHQTTTTPPPTPPP